MHEVDISYHYKKPRSQFGRYIVPEETPVRMVASFAPDPALKQKFVDINPYTIPIQTSVTYSSHIVNTEVTQTKVEEVVHKEGSWPPGIDPTNAPSCKQQRLKAEKREGFVKQLKDLAMISEKTVKLNNAINLHSDHFPATESASNVSDPSIRTISILRDKYTDRYISTISWSDFILSKRIAVCYTPHNISKPDVHYESFIYNLECSSVPEMELHAPSPLLCLEYNVKDNNCLVGGMAHGSLALWDVRSGSLPVWTSAIESSHRGAVNAVKWISSKTAFECVSTSLDGTSMTWDTRNQTSPLESVNLTAPEEFLPQGYTPPFGGKCIDYHTGVPTKFMVGTIEGLVMIVNRKSSDPNSRISGVFGGHYGPIYATRRHPTETKYFLSVSDWSVRVFSEDNKSCLLTLPAQKRYLTNAVWGQGRTSVIFTSNDSGTVDAWDIQQNLKSPICSIQVGSSPIRTMATEANGEFIITGDDSGTATLLQLNDPLKQPQSSSEKQSFIAMLGREAKRVKNFDQFIKEQKMRDKAKQSKPKDEEAAPEKTPFNPSALESEFEAAMRGEAEVIKEKKRIVIGEEDTTQQSSNEPAKISDIHEQAGAALMEGHDEPKPIEEPPKPIEKPKPVEEPPKPIEKPKPVEEPPKPIEKPKPVEEPPKPIEKPKPVEEPPKPVEKPKPVEEPPKPIEKPKPVEEPPKPVEVPKPVEEPPKPIEVPKPVEEPPKPVEEPPKPIEVPKPIEEPPKPVEEPPKPIEVPKPVDPTPEVQPQPQDPEDKSKMSSLAKETASNLFEDDSDFVKADDSNLTTQAKETLNGLLDDDFENSGVSAN